MLSATSGLGATGGSLLSAGTASAVPTNGLATVTSSGSTVLGGADSSLLGVNLGSGGGATGSIGTINVLSGDTAASATVPSIGIGR